MLVQPEAVSTLEAAERQLRVAIRPFFNRGDIITIHTLTGAAPQTLRDLAAKWGESGPLRTAELGRALIFYQFCRAFALDISES
ncbi:MAG: hypothetical protein L0Z46_07815 [Nitrospiraceae bacterium]|nr:hypothetical protein [Nitrospiraceae bacterium]